MDKEQYLIPETLEKQEHLSKARLEALVADGVFPTNPNSIRPVANFIDLMDWAVEGFKGALKDQKNLQKFVHNRIVIDGQFLQFCEERNIKIECLYKDSVISWTTEHNFEKFFAQGVFAIRAKGLEFLHAALFHKGNQQEDEISFFIICSPNNYEGYVKLRNEFDDWVLERDRSNLHIRVIEG